jgi:pyrimidine-nucleoside phosphorylase
MTSMDLPLGRAVGHSLEVIESIDCLKGSGPQDTMEVTYVLGAQMLLLTQRAKTAADAREQLERSITSGAALEKFRQMVVAQGGDATAIEDCSRLPRSKFQIPVAAPSGGFVQDVDPMAVALAVLHLGGGRATTEATIDPSVGVDRLLKVGERVEAGAPLCFIHANDEAVARGAQSMIERGIIVARQAGPSAELIGEILG